MNLAEFHQGEPEALFEAVESAFDPVWYLARQGFVCVEDGVRVYVRAADDLDIAERDARAALASALTPGARQTVTDLEDWMVHVMTHARRVLLERAVRAGRTLSLLNPEDAVQVPEEVEDLDRLIEADVCPARREPTVAPELEHRLSVGQDHAQAMKKELGHEVSELIEARFVQGQTRADCAKTFDCGQMAIAAREARARRRLSARLKRQQDPALSGARAATLDAILSGRGARLAPPIVTRERIRQSVLTSTFRTEARPFSERAMWGAGVVALAALAWTAMYLGWLPGPEDDLTPPPVVTARCPQGCQPGQPVDVAIRSPEFGRTFGVGLVDNEGRFAMLVNGPSGSTIRVPFGSRAQLVGAGRATLPSASLDLSRATVVAVFSDRKLDRRALGRAVALDTLPGHVATATTALGPRVEPGAAP